VSDWIEDFVAFTEPTGSPPAFRLWAGIATIAAVLERRVHTRTTVDKLFPNLYTFLTGAPASGKSNAIKEARKMLANIAGGTDGIKLGPDDPTRESFIDSIAASSKRSMNGTGDVMVSPITVLCSEYGVFIQKYDEAFLSTLAHIYDNPDNYSAPRRTSKTTYLMGPTVNLLVGVTPSALSSLPESAWGAGFTSRVIFIYGIAPDNYVDMFADKKPILTPDKLVADLEDFFKNLHGEFLWEQDARDAFNYWYNVEKMAPIPMYGRLVHYVGRRSVHVLKLAMVSAVSAGNGIIVTRDDFLRARRWLLEAEETMPNVFRAMEQKSDAQILSDAHYFFWTQYNSVQRNKRQPLKDSVIYRYFEEKAPSDRIPYLVSMLVKTGRMTRNKFGDWTPATLIDEGRLNTDLDTELGDGIRIADKQPTKGK
jgi:hypothetical protein